MISKLKNKKVLVAITLVVLALIVGAIFFINRTTNNEHIDREDTSTIDYSPADPEDNKDINERKENQAEDNTPPDDVDEKPNDNDDNVDEPNNSGDISVNITRAEQSGDTIFIRAFADTDTEGTCRLTLTRNGNTVVKEANATRQSSYYQCQGFNVPRSELSSGEWTAQVTYVVNNEGSESGKETFEVQ